VKRRGPLRPDRSSLNRDSQTVGKAPKRLGARSAPDARVANSVSLTPSSLRTNATQRHLTRVWKRPTPSTCVSPPCRETRSQRPHRWRRALERPGALALSRTSRAFNTDLYLGEEIVVQHHIRVSSMPVCPLLILSKFTTIDHTLVETKRTGYRTSHLKRERSTILAITRCACGQSYEKQTPEV